MLLISHTCQSATEGQPKAAHLAAMPDIELKVLVPDRWVHYGRKRGVECNPASPPPWLHIGEVRWPRLGPAQSYLHHYPRLRHLMRAFKPDVIDLWEEPWSLVSAHTTWLRNRFLPSARLVSETEQNIDKRLPPPFEQFRRYTLRHADYVVGRNHEAIEIVNHKGYRGPATVVPNGVDERLFRPMDRETARTKHTIDGFAVAYVGRLVPEKGLAELVEAISRCDDRVKLYLVGDGPMRPEIERLIASRGLEDRIKLIGRTPPQALPELMNAIDVLALPSRTTRRWKEQFGRVIIEAHCCGTPVIGSDSGAIPHVVGGGGLIVPERDPVALANAIQALADNPQLAGSCADAGRQRAHAECTWAAIAKQMHTIYRRCVDAPPQQHRDALDARQASQPIYSWPGR